MENNLVTRVEKIRHLTALWQKNTHSKPLSAIYATLTYLRALGRENEGGRQGEERERPVKQSQGECGTRLIERWERGRRGKRKRENGSKGKWTEKKQGRVKGEKGGLCP